MLTDTVNMELQEVGPEDVLTQIQLEELQHALTQQVIDPGRINVEVEEVVKIKHKII